MPDVSFWVGIVLACVFGAALVVRMRFRRARTADASGPSALPMVDGEWKLLRTKNSDVRTFVLELENGWLVRCGASVTFVPRPAEK